MKPLTLTATKVEKKEHHKLRIVYELLKLLHREPIEVSINFQNLEAFDLFRFVSEHSVKVTGEKAHDLADYLFLTHFLQLLILGHVHNEKS